MSPLFSQLPTAVSYFSVETVQGTLDLRIIPVSEAISAGNGVLKIALEGGNTGAADLVPTNSSYASPVRINTTQGTMAWRDKRVEVCGGIDSLLYEGQYYPLRGIGNQCWMTENLNVGMMVDGMTEQTNNGFLEKYCYYNNIAYCDTFGGLYQWDEAMQFVTNNGAQGICPEGWHIPTDEEWKQLEGVADSEFDYPDPEWDNTGFRGYDAGLNLRSATGWYPGGNGTDLFGFAALPGGKRYNGFYTLWWYYETDAIFWTSTEYDTESAWDRDIFYFYNTSCRTNPVKESGRSVRCLKD